MNLIKHPFFLLIFFLFSQVYSQKITLKIFLRDSVLVKTIATPKFKNETVIDSIKNRLQQKGFFKLKETDIYYGDTLRVVRFLPQNKIKFIHLQTPVNKLQLKVYKKFLGNFKKDDFFVLKTQNYSSFINSIIQEYSNQGFPFVSVKAEDISIKNNIVFLALHITTYQKRRIDKFVVKGYEDFPNKFLKNYLRSLKKTYYSDMNLKKISTYFKTFPSVSQIKDPEVLFKKDSTLIYIYLKKKKINKFDGLIGFKNSDQNSKLQVNGYLKLKLNNLFNKGNTFNINWNNNGVGSSNLDLQYKTPFVFTSPVSSDFQFQLLKKDSTNLNLNIKEVVSFLYKRNHSILIGFNYESSNSTLKILNPRVQNYSKYLVGVGYRFMIPAKTGYESKLIAFKSFFNYGLRNNTEKQVVLQAQGFYNLQINPKFYLKTQISYKELKTTTLLLNELLAIGGGDILRGFKPFSVFVDKYTVLNIDFKKYLNTDSYIKIISDYGILQNTVSSNVKDIIFSIGLGYGFKISNSGFLNINYIVSKQNKKPFNKGFLSVNLETFF